MKAVRKNVLVKMAENELNVTSLAKKISVTRSHLSQVFLGNAKVSDLMAVKIAKGLNCEVEEIFIKED
ncbi:XRE family transcriptional regulator [Macrococcoides bohemicum]|uniref:helix-turn-helix transcriptional regulator n=1 Tax=Macrococcoides bohemicum TaxID=1903056 RepID=UPI001059F269|nr:helix-turn-helix transcriptional regulator [Macrococcus bohemicus]TDL37017.1 XRE family transcriptional regulator [Macrococcus bohemicus]